MTGVMSALVFVFWGSGCIAGVLALAVALHVYSVAVLGALSTLQLLVLFVLISAVPLAAWGTVLFLNLYCYSQSTLRSLQQLGVVLALTAALHSPAMYEYLEAALRVSMQADWKQACALFLTAAGAIVFCAALVAVVVMLLLAVFEVPMRWFLEAGQFHLAIPFSAMRPLMAILMCALAFHSIGSLFFSELTPFSLLRRGVL